jgi:hypothetical protein
MLMKARDRGRVHFEVELVEEEAVLLREDGRQVVERQVADPALELPFALGSVHLPHRVSAAEAAPRVEGITLVYVQTTMIFLHFTAAIISFFSVLEYYLIK